MKQNTITNYPDLYNSYLLRQIPWNNKKKYVDFTTRFGLMHGKLDGALSRIAYILSPELTFLDTNPKAKKLVDDVLKNLNFSAIMHQAFTELFLHDYTLILYQPAQLLTVTCPECKKSTTIDSSYEYDFQIVNLSELNSKKQRYKNKLPKKIAKTIGDTYGLKCTCPKCGVEFEAEPSISSSSKPGSLFIENPKYYDVHVNPAGKEKVRINAGNYQGPIVLNTDLQYYMIEGMSWELLKVYADKRLSYLPEEKYYVLLNLSKRSALDNHSVAKLVGAVSDLLHVDILKLGNEGVSISKINPLYLISPTETAVGGSFSVIDQKQYRDFIVNEVREKEESDINRMAYSPIPVNAIPIFGDSKNYMPLNLLTNYQQEAIMSFGFSPDTIMGGDTFFQDPITIHAMDRLTETLYPRIYDLVLNILKLEKNTATIRSSVLKEIMSFNKVSTQVGSMNSSKKDMAFQNNLIPKAEYLKDIGYVKYEDYLKAKNEEAVLDYKYQNSLNKSLAKLDQEATLAAADEQATQGKLDTTAAKQQIQQDAQQWLDQLSNSEESMRRSILAQLQNEDPVLYAVVSVQWRQMQNMQNAQMKAEQQQ